MNLADQPIDAESAVPEVSRETDAQQTLPEIEPPPEPASDQIDPEAPWGRKADGTPRSKPGRKRADGAETEAEQAARLNAVKRRPPPRPAPAPSPSLGQGVPSPDGIAPGVKAQTIAPDYVALGRTAATMFFGAGIMLVGPDWEPDSADEAKEVAGAFSRYFEAQGVSDIPPGVALVMALGLYGLKRANKPTVREKFAAAWTWAKSKVSIFRRG